MARAKDFRDGFRDWLSEPRAHVTMADKSIGKCSSGHWLPLKGNCDLCGAGQDEKCRYSIPTAG